MTRASTFRRLLPVLVIALVAGTAGTTGLVVGRGSETPSTTIGTVPERRTPTAEDPLHVLLLGDSLSWEAQGAFRYLLTLGGKARVSVMAYGGTDYCTFEPDVYTFVRDRHPDVAVIEFSGNALGPCMSDPKTGRPLRGDALVEKYQSDAERVIDRLSERGVDVYIVIAPVRRDPHPEDEGLRQVVLDLARTRPVQLVDAAQAVELGGRYTDYLPCLAFEPCHDVDPATGEPAARVRASDGAHFCPSGLPAVSGVTLECASWSSGAWRFGSAMAKPVMDDFRLGL
jgi:hypothetical protein